MEREIEEDDGKLALAKVDKALEKLGSVQPGMFKAPIMAQAAYPSGK